MIISEANTRAVIRVLTDLAGVTLITSWCYSVVKRFWLWDRWPLGSLSRNVRSVMSLMVLKTLYYLC